VILHPLIENYRETLLGRLKLNLFAKIAGESGRVPSHPEMLHFTLNAWRENAISGELYTHVSLISRPHRYAVDDLPLLPEKIDHGWISIIPASPVFVEVRCKLSSDLSEIGFLIVPKMLEQGGDLLVVHVLSEHTFPDGLLGFYHVSIDSQSVRVDRWEDGDHHDLPASEIRDDPLASLTLQVLLMGSGLDS
jgi:hypothetical protein